MRNGLIQIYCGNGKGKTTAALGLALRAAGRKLKISIIQFLKTSNRYGELKTLKKLSRFVEIIQAGAKCKNKNAGKKGFICTGCCACHIDPRKLSSEDIKAAENGLELAREKIASGKFDIVILDEILYAVQLGLLNEKDVLQLLKEKPSTVELILTGGKCPKKLASAADLVTEMKEIKHHFQNGVVSIPGIDY